MGISGITAAIYAKRAGLNVMMFEKGSPGGILSTLDSIKNYPGYESIKGPDLAMELFKQVNALGVPYHFEEVISLDLNDKIKKVTTKKDTYEAKNVILATGRIPKYLGLDNEKDYLGRGISTCATCDGALYKDKDVAVVGSGNSALSESLYLANICHKVYLLHRGNAFKGDDELVGKVKEKENIFIIDNVTVDKINETDGKITSVQLSNKGVLEISGIFIYIGFRPNTEIVKDFNITNIDGDIITDEVCKTSIDGVYAIGDCIKKGVYQLVTAAADGAIAVSDIDKNN